MFATLILALAVLGWGTRYKLSLYDAPGSLSASMPHAKLLSQKERPVASGNANEISATALQALLSIFNSEILVVAVMLGLLLKVAFCVQALAIDYAYQQVRSSSNFFSFRPPPARSLS
jgi:hypothetical protein